MSEEQHFSTPVNELGAIQAPDLMDFMTFVNMLTTASDQTADLERVLQK